MTDQTAAFFILGAVFLLFCIAGVFTSMDKYDDR